MLVVPGSNSASFTRPQRNTDGLQTVALGYQPRQQTGEKLILITFRSPTTQAATVQLSHCIQ